jgi:hypothetical protein
VATKPDKWPEQGCLIVSESVFTGIFRHFQVLLRAVVGPFCNFSTDSNLDAFALAYNREALVYFEPLCYNAVSVWWWLAL